MKACPRGFVRLCFVLLIALLSCQSIGRVAAQDGTPSAVDGSTYTSPTFGYTFNWDDSLWEVSDEYSNDGYDSLALAADNAALYIEAFYFYQGDPAECLTGEREAVANDAGLDDLAPLVDDAGTRIEIIDEGVATGLYDLPATDDPDSLESTVYLQCQTLVPGSVVLVVTAFLDPELLDEQIAEVEDVTGTIDTSAVSDTNFSDADVEQVMLQTADDIDAFWANTFTDMGSTWVNPKFITFGEPIETGCGDVAPEENGPFYCPADQTVYLDEAAITGEMLPLGMVVVQAIVAHEIGHHVQELLGLQGCTDTECGVSGASLAIELQADCLAGAWMQDAASRQIFHNSDLKRVEVGIKGYFGDPPGTSQDDPDAHGDGDTRFTIFMEGYANGVSACSVN